MSCSVVLLALLLFQGEGPTQRIREVEVQGNIRLRKDALLRAVSASPGGLLEPGGLRRDIDRLWGLKQFRRIEVVTRDAGDGRVDVVYEVRELPVLSSLTFVGVSEALERTLPELFREKKVELQIGRPLDPVQLARASRVLRDVYRGRKHPEAEATARTLVNGSSTAAVLEVKPGPRIPVGSVQFKGRHSVSSRRLVEVMDASRPLPAWKPWGAGGRYVPGELETDIEQVRRLLRTVGFAAARVGPAEVGVRESPSFRSWRLSRAARKRIEIVVPVEEGPRYRMGEVRWEGDAGDAADGVRELLGKLKAGSVYDGSRLEAVRDDIVRLLGARGHAGASAALEEEPDPATGMVTAVYRIRAGRPMSFGRIVFQGNRRIPDRLLRRELKVEEGRLFDRNKLDRSVERLNRSGLVQPLGRSDVRLETDELRGTVDIDIAVREKDRQGLYATGGRNDLGAYLGALYTAFNLLGLGEVLSLQLDGGAAQSNYVLNLAASHFLGGAATVAFSAFHRVTGLNVASIVPDAGDLVSALKGRSAGAGLSGSYPVTSRVQVGSSLRVEKSSLSEGSGETAAAKELGQRLRLVAAPSLAYDTARGEGAGMRGVRFLYSRSWTAAPGLDGVLASGEGTRLSWASGDPWSGGRDSLVFRLQGGRVRPGLPAGLPAGQKYYPGGDLVRGFGPGGASPWFYDSGDRESPLKPAGADAVAGASGEYRVPLAGTLSGAAFFDLGWTRLSPAGGSSLTGELVQATNRVLRASTGVELRLQIPYVRQPARLILAWNPLGLRSPVSTAAGTLRVADPRRSIRFAFGELF